MLKISALRTCHSFSFQVYARADFQTNRSGGGGNFNLEVLAGSPGRFRKRLLRPIELESVPMPGESPDVNIRMTHAISRLSLGSTEHQYCDQVPPN